MCSFILFSVQIGMNLNLFIIIFFVLFSLHTFGLCIFLVFAFAFYTIFLCFAVFFLVGCIWNENDGDHHENFMNRGTKKKWTKEKKKLFPLLGCRKILFFSSLCCFFLLPLLSWNFVSLFFHFSRGFLFCCMEFFIHIYICVYDCYIIYLLKIIFHLEFILMFIVSCCDIHSYTVSCPVSTNNKKTLSVCACECDDGDNKNEKWKKRIVDNLILIRIKLLIVIIIIIKGYKFFTYMLDIPIVSHDL